MKIARGGVARAVDQPDGKVRFYLFHGADESQSRSLAYRLLAGLGATRAVLAASAVKSDPALLAAEAGAMTLFDGARLIWLEPAGDEISEGVGALLEAQAVESPVVALAGALRRGSGLLKLAESSPLALSHVSYIPEGQEAERMVAELGRTVGLKIAAPVAARIADGSGNDRAIVRQELEKISLFLDASTASPKELDHDALDAVGADLAEGDNSRLADLALAGRIREVADELGTLIALGGEAVPVIRSLQRRLLMLAPLQARVECGESVAGVMASADKSLFFKEKPMVSKLLQQWDAAGIARLFERCGKLERNSMLTPLPPLEALAEELIAVARAAQRR